ncbi:GNAT family N-acetyltransferase [Polaromonas sp.]|uniref:GNAT family N-acetyltransferase n=1 Tax=Polaromonas sp. TaxID=1869339 RepID=UPI003264EF9F
MNIIISAATKEEVQTGYVGRQLREFNYRHVGEYPETQYIRLNARDGEGSVVGGIRALVFMYWLRVEVLWVHDQLRGTGIGSRLPAEAETIALALGAKNSVLETFEWQAPTFYVKHGYREVSRIENYIGRFHLLLMKKRL